MSLVRRERVFWPVAGSNGQWLSVRGFSVQDKPAVNQKQIGRGYSLA